MNIKYLQSVLLILVLITVLYSIYNIERFENIRIPFQHYYARSKGLSMSLDDVINQYKKVSDLKIKFDLRKYYVI